jgi:hypothetical protein
MGGLLVGTTTSIKAIDLALSKNGIHARGVKNGGKIYGH